MATFEGRRNVALKGSSTMPTFGKDEPIVSYNFDVCTKKLKPARKTSQQSSTKYLLELPASPRNTSERFLKKRTRLSLPAPLCIENYVTSEDPKPFSSDEEDKQKSKANDNPFSSLLVTSKLSASTCDTRQEQHVAEIKENAYSRPTRWDRSIHGKRKTTKLSRATKKYVLISVLITEPYARFCSIQTAVVAVLIRRIVKFRSKQELFLTKTLPNNGEHSNPQGNFRASHKDVSAAN